MMKLKISLAFFYISFILTSCASSSEVLYSWVNSKNFEKKDYKKIFVIALTENKNIQTSVENSFVEPITNAGLDVVTSHEIFQRTFTKSTLPSKEEILGKVKELGCDLIFVVSLLDSKSETKYVSSYYSYAPYPRFGYYGMFGTYYGYWGNIVYEPGYYTSYEKYFLEGNLFDAVSENILWSIQSTTYDPKDIQSFSKEYSKLVIDQAIKDGVVKRIIKK